MPALTKDDLPWSTDLVDLGRAVVPLSVLVSGFLEVFLLFTVLVPLVTVVDSVEDCLVSGWRRLLFDSGLASSVSLSIDFCFGGAFFTLLLTGAVELSSLEYDDIRFLLFVLKRSLPGDFKAAVALFPGLRFSPVLLPLETVRESFLPVLCNVVEVLLLPDAVLDD